MPWKKNNSFDFLLLLPVLISECILHYLLLSHVPAYVSCGGRHGWESDLYQLRKEKLLTALGNPSFLFLLQQLEKCV